MIKLLWCVKDAPYLTNIQGVIMQLTIEVNDAKSSMFLEFLETFKLGNIVNQYSIISESKDKETIDILEDIAMLNSTLKDAQSGLGKHTRKYINLNDV